MGEQKERLYNLDLIRIIAMMMVVTLHFLGKNGLWDAFPVSSWQYNVVWALVTLCNIGVNVFVLISGYFLFSSAFRFKKLLLLEAEVLFYSIFIYLLMILTSHATLNFGDLVSAFMPILTGKYWFITMYFGMYIMSPFLNKMLGGLNKRDHGLFILVLVGLFSLWPVLGFTVSNVQSYSLNYGFSALWFVVLYIIAAYLKRYYLPDYVAGKHFIRYFVAALLSVVIMIGTTYLGSHNIEPFSSLRGILNGYNSITILIPSVLFFIFMLNVRIKPGIPAKLIAIMSPLTFGVYLIHEELHFSNFLWSTLNPTRFINNWYFAVYAAGCILLVYLTASFIDWLRQRLFRYPGKALFSDLETKLRQYDLRLIKKSSDSSR